MVPLEQLLTALEGETEAAARELLEEARRSAERTLEEAEADARREASASAEREETAWREALERDLAACRREGRLRWLRAREALLDRVFQLATERLPAAAAGRAYGASIPAELDLALPFLGEAACVVHCPPAHAGLAREYLEGRPDIRVEPDQPGGLRLIACDGSIEVDRTLERRMESRRLPLSVAVMKELDSGCEPAGTT